MYGTVITDGISSGLKYSMNKEEERMRRVKHSAVSLRNLKQSLSMENNAYPIALIISLILLYKCVVDIFVGLE